MRRFLEKSPIQPNTVHECLSFLASIHSEDNFIRINENICRPKQCETVSKLWGSHFMSTWIVLSNFVKHTMGLLMVSEHFVVGNCDQWKFNRYHFNRS